MPVDESDARSGASHAVLTREQARGLAREAGFDEAGLIELPHAETVRDASRFKQWVQEGRAGTMRYLERSDDNGQLVRARTATPFPWARSAIVCFAVYNTAHPRSIDAASSEAGWIGRYAWTSRVDAAGLRRPTDYHKVLLISLRKLESQLHEQSGEFQSRAYVDTGPVVERALATAAGLGWTGKNTCLIHPKMGSFAFLAVLLTSLPAQQQSTPAVVPDRCGTCCRCLEACPTGALIAPYQMDATRCISYLTIEHKGPIAPELMEGMGRQIFGCDICQDVCPWNRKSPIATSPEFEARADLVNPALEWLTGMDEQQFERTFNGSPVRRAGFLGLKRNIAVAMGNSGAARFQPLLRAWLASADEGVRSAAEWALKKLKM